MSFATDKELAAYKSIVDEIIHGDPAKKKSIDALTAYSIDQIKEIIPTATDEETARVLMMFAVIMMHVNTMPLQIAPAFVTSAVEGYIVSVAVLAGAYTPDPANIPDITKESKNPGDPFTGRFSDKEWDDQLRKAYL